MHCVACKLHADGPKLQHNAGLLPLEAQATKDSATLVIGPPQIITGCLKQGILCQAQAFVQLANAVLAHVQRFFGTAVGKGRQAAKTEIERLKLREIACEQGINEVAKMCACRLLHPDALFGLAKGQACAT